MKDKSLNKEKEYRKLVKSGRQNLRISLIFFVFILIATIAGQGYALFKLYEKDYTEVLLNFAVRAAVMLFIWLLAISKLWKYRKTGRFLYFVACAISCYGLKELYTFYEAQSHAFSTSLYFYGFLVLGIIIRIAGIRNTIHYFKDKAIRSIWSVYDMFDDELDELDVYEDEKALPEIEEVNHDTPLMVKAKKHMRSKARMLAIFLYCFCIFVILCVVIIKTQLPDMEEYLELIQYFQFMASLFSMFVWSIPVVILYLYKPYSKVTLLGAGILELLHALFSVSNYWKIASSPMVDPLKWMYFLFEFIRIFMLLTLALRVSRDPYIYAFWKNEERIYMVDKAKKKIKK